MTYGLAPTGGYVHFPAAGPSMAGPAGFGTFGEFGSWATATAQIVGAVAMAGATIYGTKLAADQATHLRHQQARDAEAAKQAAAAAAAQAEATKIEQIAALQAEGAVGGAGVLPSGSSVMTSLKGVPTWVWLAGAGGLAAAVLLRRRP